MSLDSCPKIRAVQRYRLGHLPEVESLPSGKHRDPRMTPIMSPLVRIRKCNARIAPGDLIDGLRPFTLVEELRFHAFASPVMRYSLLDKLPTMRPLHSAGKLPIGRFGGRSPPREILLVVFLPARLAKNATKEHFCKSLRPPLASSPAGSSLRYDEYIVEQHQKFKTQSFTLTTPALEPPQPPRHRTAGQHCARA